MVLKGVNWSTQCINSVHMILKGVNWLHNDKIRLNCLERSQLGIQCHNLENQVILCNGLERSH